MATDDKDFLVLAVKLLFKRLAEGKVTLVEEKVPQTVKALRAVQFDKDASPLYETITAPVRSLANLVYGLEIQELDEEAAEREKNSPVHALLGEPVRVDEDVLRECAGRSTLSRLAFELYKETAGVLAICSHAYTAEKPGKAALGRNQAICAGLIVRITKLMLAVAQLSAGGERGEIVLILNRCIMESSTNLRFLLLKDEQRFYDQFVTFSLSPERELYEVIHGNIKARSGEVLPIEERMLASIARACARSGVKIEDVPPKSGDWGGGLRQRLEALGEATSYVSIQRIPSHAVHGTWIDLILHHLTETADGFTPDPGSYRVDARIMSPVCVIVLEGAEAYLDGFFGDLPDLRPLRERMDDLAKRLQRLDAAHEEWLAGQTGDRPDVSGGFCSED